MIDHLSLGEILFWGRRSGTTEISQEQALAVWHRQQRLRRNDE